MVCFTCLMTDIPSNNALYFYQITQFGSGMQHFLYRLLIIMLAPLPLQSQIITHPLHNFTFTWCGCSFASFQVHYVKINTMRAVKDQGKHSANFAQITLLSSGFWNNSTHIDRTQSILWQWSLATQFKYNFKSSPW